MKIKVSDLIVEFLEQEDVKNVFLLSGGMMMHLLDSLSRSTKIQYTCTHHEQAAAMAAEGVARVNGRLGVCYVTSGPGATNAVTGIAGAWLDSSPILCITGQSRRTLTARGINRLDIRMVGNFEVNILDIVRPITKYAAFVDDPRKIIYHLGRALWEARSGRPGPVLLDIPLDIQGALVDREDLEHFVAPPATLESAANLHDFSKYLASSSRPLIIAGNGIRIAGMADRFSRLAERWGVPIVTTQLAKDLMPYEHPLFVGHPGLRGTRAGNFAVQAADLVIAIGTSLHVTTTGYDLDCFAPNAKKIWIDVDAAHLARNHVNAELTLQLSVQQFITAAELLPPIPISNFIPWCQICRRWKELLPIAREHLIKDDRIETYNLVDILSNLLQGGETLVTDAGSLYYIVGQAFKPKEGQRVIVSGAMGAMGYALPASLGISVENANRTTICLTGDGSMQLNVQELATVARIRPNLKIIVISNDGYASIRNTQITFCGGNIAGASTATGVGMPNWSKLCAAYGLDYMSCDRNSCLPSVLQQAISATGPVFVELVAPETVVLSPAVTSEKLPDGTFKSARLHEMSPPLSREQKNALGIDESLYLAMERHRAP